METTPTAAEALTAEGHLVEVLNRPLSAEQRELRRVAAFHGPRLAARLGRTLVAHLMAVEMQKRKAAAFRSEKDERFYKLATEGEVTYRFPVDSGHGSSLPRDQGSL